MKSILLHAVLAGAAAVAQIPSQTSTASINPTDFLAQISAFGELNPAISAPFGNPSTTINVFDIGAPPSSLVSLLITAIPATVLGQIMNPTGRSSIAAEFQAGNTPSWFNELPTEVKSYVGAMQSKINAGNLVESGANAIPSAFGGRGGGAGASGADGGAGAESTSSALAPAPTGALGMGNGMFAAGVAGMVGILGLAIGL
ncbi:hypothetical protein P152DRAFT_445440 [Eremomyces bilateralis CBS 781.70]|uniref:Uncharacterized protein n=1 Tax=Eremomyces bilateralis CBS 781.70 TaxID=1392243 RepID=A0A6G1GGV3_9PEZI|nr:uncharacterized protein P152DRAFT_445440 [Eremomyces bilateralis CBS 781.70]KAF1817337.1 hypothetical protein P152DRAFT_445440 [Eremomyces bilateralis CBS 781.70]